MHPKCLNNDSYKRVTIRSPYNAPLYTLPYAAANKPEHQLALVGLPVERSHVHISRYRIPTHGSNSPSVNTIYIPFFLLQQLKKPALYHPAQTQADSILGCKGLFRICLTVCGIPDQPRGPMWFVRFVGFGSFPRSLLLYQVN